MKFLLITLATYVVGVLALLFYTKLHQSPDDDVPYGLVLLVIFFWPIVLVFDIIINGADVWEMFKARLH